MNGQIMADLANMRIRILTSGKQRQTALVVDLLARSIQDDQHLLNEGTLKHTCSTDNIDRRFWSFADVLNLAQQLCANPQIFIRAEWVTTKKDHSDVRLMLNPAGKTYGDKENLNALALGILQLIECEIIISDGNKELCFMKFFDGALWEVNTSTEEICQILVHAS
jgi:hypothetical protein